ncbi:MAG: ribosome recycling factor [Candidatus Sericytochromatia bacterium]|nr:ribosome recycling factor [Candidatus Sericytochromatia bacterium]
MSTQDIIHRAEDKMKKAIAATQRDFASIRTGRASAALLDRISVDYYGAETPIKSMGNISTPDSRTIQIQVFDRGSVGLVEKAIHKSDLGLTPNTDGQLIRLNIPPLTEERRKDMVKVAKKSAEDGRVAIRNVRRDEMDAVKKLEKANECTEDDRKRSEDQIQKLTDRFIKELDELLAHKEREILEV